MQMPTACQFQAAFLGAARALPMPDTQLEQSLLQWLRTPTVTDLGEEMPQSVGHISPLLYCLPALFLDAGLGALPTGFDTIASADPSLHADLALLQGIITAMLTQPCYPRNHFSLRQLLAGQLISRSATVPPPMSVPPLMPVEIMSLEQAIAVEAQVQSRSQASMDGDSQDTGHPHTPVRMALTALLTVSESAPLTVRLAQMIAPRHQTDPILAGAIAGLLVGLHHRQTAPPKTESEQRLQTLTQQLFATWAGLQPCPQPTLAVLPPIV